jgi:two-component system cell cycle sensor histidine kinase/response regulator CckA
MPTSSTIEGPPALRTEPAALLASEVQFHELLDGLPVLIWTARPDGFVDSCNRGWCEYTGMTLEQSLGSGWMAAVHPEDVGTTGVAVAEAFGLGRPYQVEHRLRRHDGKYRWFLVRSTPVRDSSGQVVHWQGANVDIDDRKEAEQALLVSEGRVRTILQSSMAGFWMVDPAGRLTEVNEAYCRMSGYSAQELTAMRVSDLETTESATATAAHIDKIMALGQDRFESRHRRKDGSLFDVEVSVQYQAGERGYMAAFLEDITERKRSEGTLKAEMANSDAIFEASPVAMLILDETTNIVRANTASVVMLGGDRSDIEQHRPGNAMRCVHSSKDPRGCGYAKDCLLCEARNGIEALIAGGGAMHGVELKLALVRDGKRREIWMEFGAEQVTLNGRRHLCVALADITEPKRAEEALRENEAKFRTYVEAAPQALFVVDGKGRYLDFNPAALEMIGVDGPTLRSMTIADLHGEASREGAFRDFGTLVATGRLESEYELLRPDGGRVWVMLRGVRISDDRFMAFCEDITEPKRLGIEREKLGAQLRQFQKMEGIGRLAGGIAHDFNNILSVILSNAGFALESLREGDRLREDILEIEKAGKRAAALTRQLLAFSRKQLLQPTTLDLNHVIGEMEKMLRRIIGEDIDFIQKLAPDLGLTLADSGQIEQVLMNLVVNARDAMPKGGGLTIETSNVEVGEEVAARQLDMKSGPYVQLAISDTGCGMDKNTLARIFEPFFTTKETGKGTGLGLSTVYGIVKQSGGSIWVDSEPGQGTTFKIYLPRELSTTTNRAVKPAMVPNRSTGTETVLVVDDEEALLRIAARALQEVGYTVLTAANGEEALVKSAQHAGDIQVLLTDVVMPRMSGSALAQELSKKRPTVKVVYMSGYADGTIIHHGVVDPGTHLLAKPFTSTDLTRKIREVLESGVTKAVDGDGRAVGATGPPASSSPGPGSWRPARGG